MTMTRLTIETVNAFDASAFLAAFGTVFEHSPWIVEDTYAARPFASREDLHAKMMGVVRNAPMDRKLALLCAHPELAGREAQQGTMTDSSTSEQGRLGFDALSRAELARMTELNRLYRETFGFPCMIALSRHATRDTVMAEHEDRLGRDRDTEIATCIEQIAIITDGRLLKLFEPGA